MGCWGGAHSQWSLKKHGFGFAGVGGSAAGACRHKPLSGNLDDLFGSR